MRYLFELSKEHKTLPTAEVLACLRAEKIDGKIIVSNKDVLVIKADSKEDKIKRLADRLSFTFFIDEFLFSCSNHIKEIKKKAQENTFDKKGSIAIKYKNRSNTVDSQPILQELAEIYSKHRNVNLKDPDIEIRGLITDSNVYVGIKTAEINRRQFEERKVQNRPFFSPISLHPKLARAMVNLSSIKKDEILLDPFCGTGGILIEAGLNDLKVIGSDIEYKMIEGSRKNLDFYKIKNYELYHSDIGDIKKYVKKVDSVVTDLPYGKSTTTKGEKKDKLYERAFKNISVVLKKKGRAVIGLSQKDMISVGEKYLSLLERHEFITHRSLTRYFIVYEK